MEANPPLFGAECLLMSGGRPTVLHVPSLWKSGLVGCGLLWEADCVERHTTLAQNGARCGYGYASTSLRAYSVYGVWLKCVRRRWLWCVRCTVYMYDV
jgi:hypothetical protein